MFAIIQSIPARYELALKQREALGFPCEIYVDEKLSKPFKGFWDSLLAYDSSDDYRLHMQDDLIYCDDFRDYIPEVMRLMREEDMHLFSLYGPRVKQLREAHAKGRRYCQSFKGFAMQCIVFSPWLVEKMKELAPYYTGSHHDDWFVSEVVLYTKIKPFVHLPSLCQHNIWEIPSSMRHPKSIKRTSEIFEKDFVTKWKSQQPISQIK